MSNLTETYSHAMAVDPKTNKIMKKVAGLSIGGNDIVYDGTVSWANSEAAGTAKQVDVVLPELLQGDALYEVVVTNPSSATALTAVLKNKETFGTVVKYPEVKTLNVVASKTQGVVNIVQGWLLGEAGRITISNDTAISTTGAFTAEVRIRKV